MYLCVKLIKYVKNVKINKNVNLIKYDNKKSIKLIHFYLILFY